MSPGTREFGVAVFEDLDLLYYATKDLGKLRQGNTKHSLAREAVRIVESLVHQYQPQRIVLQRLGPLQRLSPKLVFLTSQIRGAVHKQRVPVHIQKLTLARKTLCPYQRATRCATAARLVSLYPELTRYVSNVTLWQRLYYAPMLNAVTIGYVRQQRAAHITDRKMLAISDARIRRSGIPTKPLT